MVIFQNEFGIVRQDILELKGLEAYCPYGIVFMDKHFSDPATCVIKALCLLTKYSGIRE